VVDVDPVADGGCAVSLGVDAASAYDHAVLDDPIVEGRALVFASHEVV
jgi:hypothetical protein